MCLYPRLIINPKYKANKKNGGCLPPVLDDRVLYVPIKCNRCMECRKQISREWQARLLEDIKHNKNGKFITLTFTDKSIHELCQEEIKLKLKNGDTEESTKIKIDELKGYSKDNAIATKAVRLFLERWRKKYKKSLRHWLVTEIGHNGTENIHLHGIIWTNEKLEEVERIWKYGYVWKGKQTDFGIENYVNEKTVGYITKYITKIDQDHKSYKGLILTSAGIGAGYMNRTDWTKNRYQGDKTKEYFRTQTGHKISLPIYWRNKIYSEEEREKLWIHKLNKQERWVCGEKVKIDQGEEQYKLLLQYYRRKNTELGYDDGLVDYNRELYERQRRELMHKTRIAKAKNTGL